MFPSIVYITINSIKHQSLFTHSKFSNSSITNNSVQHKSFICTQFKCPTVLFDPLIGPCKVDLGAMAIKGCSTFPKDLALLKPHHQIVQFHIQDTRRFGGSVEMQSVYSTGLNSEFSFSQTSCHTKVKKRHLPESLPVTGENIGFIPFLGYQHDVKYKRFSPGFEHVSLCSFPMAMCITHRMSPK